MCETAKIAASSNRAPMTPRRRETAETARMKDRMSDSELEAWETGAGPAGSRCRFVGVTGYSTASAASISA